MAQVRKRKRDNKEGRVFKAFYDDIESESLDDLFPALKAQSSTALADEFQTFYGDSMGDGFSILEPMYPPAQLIKHVLASGVLRTAIEAMATNIDGFGYTLEYIGEDGGQDSTEALEEKERAKGLLDHPNGEYSLVDLRKRMRIDKESMGYCAMEVIRDNDDGFPVMLTHVPAHSVRKTTQEKERAVAYRYMPRPGAVDNMVQVQTRFRRFVQMIGNKKVYFRENGDSRPIDHTTGKSIGGTVDDSVVASDMILDCIYTPGSTYGAPRWIGELRSVLGIQESENTNLSYFKDNGIPAMMLLVLGGAMSAEGQKNFKKLVNTSRGVGMQNRIMMMDIQGDEMSASDKGMIQRPEVKLEPLMQLRQQDAFFQEYEGNAAKKIRSSFRLPALFTGLTEEIRFAVAQASLTVAESQVFGPERSQTDDVFNYQVLTYNGEPMKFWRYKSNPPRIVDNDALIDAMDTFENVGAMTPNVAIQLANEMFDMDIEMVDEEWGDKPFSLTTGANLGGQGNEAPTQGAEEGAEDTPKKAVRKRRRVRVTHAHKDAQRPGGTVRRRVRTKANKRTVSRKLTQGTTTADKEANRVENDKHKSG